MRVKMTGCGKLGSMLAGYVSSLGHDVYLDDKDTTLVRRLINNDSPFADKCDLGGCCKWTTDKEIDANIICVDTPSLDNGLFNCSKVANSVIRGTPNIIISTVTPGFCFNLNLPSVIYCPTMIALGEIQFDNTLRFAGCHASVNREEISDFLHGLFNQHIKVLSYEDVEVGKLMLNVYLAGKCEFTTRVSEIAGNCNANTMNVLEIIREDPRVNPAMLNWVGPPTGPCLPRDVNCAAKLYGNVPWLTRIVNSIINAQPERVVICGISYKPGVPYDYNSLGKFLGNVLIDNRIPTAYYCKDAGHDVKFRDSDYVVEIRPGTAPVTPTLSVWQF